MSSNYPFSYKQGTTYKGAEFTYQINGTIVDLTGAVIHIEIRAYQDFFGPIVEHFENGKGVTLSDPTNGKFTWDAQVFGNLIGNKKYSYDIRIVLSNGEIRNDVNGIIDCIGVFTYA